MRTLNMAIALMLSLAIHAQTFDDIPEVGRYVVDASGRYVQLIATDGVVVDYLYDKPGNETSGVVVHVNEKLTLTVTYPNRDEIAVPGLPKITQAYDFQGRATTVFADGKPIAYFDYMREGYFAAVTLPGHFTWKCSAPESHRVRQTVEAAGGEVVMKAAVTTDFLTGIRHDTSYQAVAEELGIDLDTITYEYSPTGLTIARDAKGREAFYVLGGPGFEVGFSPDGKPLFYDVSLSVTDGEAVAGSCLILSKTFEGQRGTFPDHLVLTKRGAVGLYAHDSANGAIDAAWTNLAGKVFAKSSEVEPDSRPRQ